MANFVYFWFSFPIKDSMTLLQQLLYLSSLIMLVSITFPSLIYHVSSETYFPRWKVGLVSVAIDKHYKVVREHGFIPPSAPPIRPHECSAPNNTDPLVATLLYSIHIFQESNLCDSVQHWCAMKTEFCCNSGAVETAAVCELNGSYCLYGHMTPDTANSRVHSVFLGSC